MATENALVSSLHHLPLCGRTSSCQVLQITHDQAWIAAEAPVWLKVGSWVAWEKLDTVYTIYSYHHTIHSCIQWPHSGCWDRWGSRNQNRDRTLGPTTRTQVDLCLRLSKSPQSPDWPFMELPWVWLIWGPQKIFLTLLISPGVDVSVEDLDGLGIVFVQLWHTVVLKYRPCRIYGKDSLHRGTSVFKSEI